MRAVAQPASKESANAKRPGSEPVNSAANDWAGETLFVQRKTCPCGGSCPKCAGAQVVQPKLILGESHDRYEREADEFAEGFENGGAQKTLSAVDRNVADIGDPLPAAASSLVSRALRSSSAQTLSPAALRPFESRLPVSTSAVRVHTNGEAAAAADALGARAFTAGHDIVFGANQFAPETREGRGLLAHELAHVTQQSAAGPAPGPPMAQRAMLVQRQGKDAPVKDAGADAADLAPTEEEPKYKWIDYTKAAAMNRKWFGLFQLANMNPLTPYDPFTTPNAFINRVAAWQIAVHRGVDGVSFSQFVFAAGEEQAKVRSGSPETALAGIDKVAKSAKAGTFQPGLNVDPDGVLGASTLWTMMVADAMSTNPANVKALHKAKIPIELLNFAESDPGAYQATWRAVHAYQFNKPRFKATWTTLAQADTVFETFDELDILPDSDYGFLTNLFFDGTLPETPAIADHDLIAILARGYQGEAVELLASIMEVDRSYYSAVDVERLVLQQKPDWRQTMDLRMAETLWPRANKLIEDLDLNPPQTPAAKAALTRLEENDGRPPANQPMSVLAVIARLPDKDEKFWKETAKKYVDDKVALEKAADEATQDYLKGLTDTYKKRMGGTPDIQKSDGGAFLELLVGDAFDDSQKALQEENSKPVPGVDITQRLQARTGGDKAEKLYALAQQKDYVIVQLSDDKDSRFPLPIRQIDASRAAAVKNGSNPLMFDMIDTPHAAMHGYMPQRFTARKTENGSEAAVGPYQLSEDKDALSYEKWQGRITHEFATFDPVLIEINEFNPDAGFLFRLGRQAVGTDKIVAQYFWTLGGSLPNLSDQLWSSQGRINIMGWVDAVLTVVALGALVAAPLAAGLEASGSSAAAELGEQAISAAMRRALYLALRKFVINEAIGEILNRISYFMNSDPDVPEGLKKAWNGLMIALLVYGGTKLVRQGIKAYRNVGGAALKAQLAALEKELDAGVRGGKTELSASEAAAEAEIKSNTTEKFQQAAGADGGESGGAGRVRSDDPRASDVTAKPDTTLTPQDSSDLRKALGDDLANAVEAGTNETARKRLAQIKLPDAIKKLAEAFKPKELARILAAVEIETLAEFAKTLEKEALSRVLKAFSGKPAGVRLMRAFASDPARLSILLASFDELNLMSLAENPGAEKFFQVASAVDPALFGDALSRMGKGKAGSMTRFRNLLEAVGPERTAQVLNTYTPLEIRARWKPRGQLSAPQNVTRLAISYDGATPNRARLGSVPTASDARPSTFFASDFGSFYAVGPEASAPATVRSTLATIQAATAAAANRLEELIARAGKGMLTDADLQALPPNARATVDAFLEAGPKDLNRAALYGSALQYLAEAELRKQGGGVLPAGPRSSPSENPRQQDAHPRRAIGTNLKQRPAFSNQEHLRTRGLRLDHQKRSWKNCKVRRWHPARHLRGRSGPARSATPRRGPEFIPDYHPEKNRRSTRNSQSATGYQTGTRHQP